MNSSTSNFKITLKVFLFVLVFFVLNLIVGYILSIPKRKLIEAGYFHPQKRWSEFYQQKKNSIDLLFLGSSHCYRSFNPAIFDEKLGTNSFNMASPSQSPLTSYYVLKEVLKRQSPKIVILEVFWYTFDTTNQYVNALYNL